MTASVCTSPPSSSLRLSAWAVLLTAALLLAPGTASPVQAQSVDSILVNTKTLLGVGYRTGDVDKLREARATFERVARSGQHTALAHYYAGLAGKRILDVESSDMGEDAKLEVIDASIEHFKTAKEQDEDFAETYALLASMYGRKMGVKPQLGMFLGPRTSKLMEKANQMAPDNPRIVLLQATSDYFTPESWGGDKEKALKGFRRATELYADESVENPVMPEWGHSEAYAWLGIALMKKEQYDGAGAAFQKALEVDSDFAWVREVLIPQLKKEGGDDVAAYGEASSESSSEKSSEASSEAPSKESESSEASSEASSETSGDASTSDGETSDGETSSR